jgi:hypothetical protein
LSYAYADSPSMRMTSDFTTTETDDHGRFTFHSKRHQDGELFQEVEGIATLDNTKGGKATFATPADLQFDLDKGSLFPTAHTQALLEAARAGKKFFSTTVFDGTDDKGPVEVTALIGAAIQPLPVLQVANQIDKTLLANRAWKIRLAFFPLESPGDTSDYELSMVIHENGVISDMTIDYSDFSVKQKLLALEPLADLGCDSENASPR